MRENSDEQRDIRLLVKCTLVAPADCDNKDTVILRNGFGEQKPEDYCRAWEKGCPYRKFLEVKPCQT